MPETISDTRSRLTIHVERFRREGAGAEPVVFGNHRRAEAVLLPYEAFELLMAIAEDALIAERVTDRSASDGGRRTSLADVARELGIDLDTL